MGNAITHIIAAAGEADAVVTADDDALSRANEGAQSAAFAASETAAFFGGSILLRTSYPSRRAQLPSFSVQRL